MIHVFIDEFYPTSYRVLVRFYVTTNDTAEMLNVRQDILFAIRQIFQELTIILANPAEDEWLRYKNKLNC